MGEFFTHREQAKPARSLPSSAGRGRYIHESRHVCEIRCNRNSATSEPAQPGPCKTPILTARVLASCLVAIVVFASTTNGDGPQPGGAPQPATVVISTLDAAEVLRHARQMLMKTPSLQASIQHRGRLAAGAFESSGTYRAGQFPRLRIETTTELAGLTGRSIEICDGQVLWTERRIEGLPIDPDDEESDGTQTIVTRRDIDLIRDALANSPQTSDHVLAAELGVGGLPSLLAGLQTAFDFRASRTETGEIVLRGFGNRACSKASSSRQNQAVCRPKWKSCSRTSRPSRRESAICGKPAKKQTKFSPCTSVKFERTNRSRTVISTIRFPTVSK